MYSLDLFQVHPFSPHAKLVWREGPPVPEKIWWAQATVISGKVYVGGGMPTDSDSGRLVYKYDPVRNEWSTLPPVPVDMFGVGQLNGRLVLVGGSPEGGGVTADIHVFDEETQQWVKPLPPMPSALACAAVISHGSALVVCGGTSPDGKPSAAVYVYNSESSQWHSAPPLPFRRTLCTGVVISNMCYVAAGLETVFGDDMNMDACFNSESARRSVVSAPLPILLDPNASSSQPSSVWKSLPDLPHYHPSIAAVGGCLLALGGHKEVPAEAEDVSADDVITAVHAYCPATSSWLQIGDLPTQRFVTTTVPLPTGELLFAGGERPGDEEDEESEELSCYIGTIK